MVSRCPIFLFLKIVFPTGNISGILCITIPIRLHQNDTVLLKMYCVDKNIYNYFFTLAAVTGNNNFRSASPANPNSNISNGALGYFSAHTISQKKIVVY